MRVVSQQLTSNGLTRLWQLVASTWSLLELEDQETKNFDLCFYIGGQKKTLFFLDLLPPFELS
jgi:hypothetical protein